MAETAKMSVFLPGYLILAFGAGEYFRSRSDVSKIEKEIIAREERK